MPGDGRDPQSIKPALPSEPSAGKSRAQAQEQKRDQKQEQETSIRPALPLLLLPLGGLWLGLFCAEYLAFNGVYIPPVGAIMLGILSVVCGIFGVTRARGRRWLRATFLLLMSATLGLATGMGFWVSADERAQAIAAVVAKRPQELCELTILEDPKQGVISMTSLAALEVTGVGHTKVRVFWDSEQEPRALGTHLVAHVEFKPLTETQAFLHQKGVFGSVSLKNIEVKGTGFPATPLGAIHAFREHNRLLLADFEGEGSALLRGVLLGDTTELDQAEAGRAFKVTGLSHLVAVSGSHLVVIALLITWLIRSLGVRRSIEVTLVTLLLVSYVFLTGLQPSAIRACVMAFIASMATFAGRRGHIPSALATAAVGMLLLSPPTAFSVGFWLSVFAVFGLTIFCPLVSRYLACLLPHLDTHAPPTRGKAWHRVRRMVRRALIDPLALTITAQMATLPITAPLFATVSLVSPLANLLVTPFITLLVGAGIAALCLMPLLGPLGTLTLSFLCGVAEISISLATWCAQLPHACLPVSLSLAPAVFCALLAAALIYRLWPQPSRKRSLLSISSFALVSLLLSASTLLPAAPQIVMLDVGQGDAILIREGSANVLIDTGQSDATLLRALARQRVGRLDAVIVTHLDEDHTGALDALSGTIPVEHIFFAQGLAEAKADDEALQAARLVLGGKTPEELAWGDRIKLGERIELVMLWPDHAIAGGGNEESICLGLSYDEGGSESMNEGAEARVLLTGDAESPQLDRLFAGMFAQHFDALKVGHHGSGGAVTAEQLELMGCQFALISVGRDNRYGHPTPETLATLDQAGVNVYRTDLNGDVTVRFRGERLLVRCDTMTEVT
ncbi:MAG: DNA internalization-related competence protein ComEC/Rec2 [Coriobacteriales bacterium]|jgi:competence protein ComEC|nr:DNA internalization-related competence protein ComEC/Rec2 [Coriobacteriales bacterium]